MKRKMKRNMFLLAGLCVFALAPALIAGAGDEPANVAGRWEMTAGGRQGNITQTLTIEQDGDKIKGTLKGPRAETPFEGSVKGNQVHFTVRRETPRGEMTVEYTGNVEGDSMKGTMPGGRFNGDWSARRKEEKDKDK
jgi:hypothetical protein